MDILREQLQKLRERLGKIPGLKPEETESLNEIIDYPLEPNEEDTAEEDTTEDNDSTEDADNTEETENTEF